MNDRSLLISDRVLQHFPELMELCERQGSAVFRISEKVALFDQLFFHQPNAVILADAEAGESAIVLCESIRSEPRLDGVKIVIASQRNSQAMKTGAAAAGCDLYASLAELSSLLPAFLKLIWMPQGLVQFDRAPRFDLTSEVEIFLRNQGHRAQTKNASRSGMYLLSSIQVDSGTPLVLRFTAKNGLPIDVEVRVTRCEHFQKIDHGFRYGLGIAVENLDKINQKKLYTQGMKENSAQKIRMS